MRDGAAEGLQPAACEAARVDGAVRPAAGHGTALHLQMWRHPRPAEVEGRCIGRTDVPVDRRRAKRLAHRIRQHARRAGWPPVVWTSPLRRCADVGAWLARWGWRHRIDARLCELDFGSWEGRRWTDIGQAPVDAWCADFAHARPGGGESLAELFARCRRFVQDHAAPAGAAPVPAPLLVVAHAGWMQAASVIAAGNEVPRAAADWMPAVGHGNHLTVIVGGGAACDVSSTALQLQMPTREPPSHGQRP